MPFPPRGVPRSLSLRGKKNEKRTGSLTKLAHVLEVLRQIACLPRNGEPKSKWTYFKGLLEEQEKGAREPLQSPEGELILNYDVKECVCRG